MERECFFSGYCRQIDGSRMVEVIVTDGRVEEADCLYGACPYEGSCPIGKQIAAAGEPDRK